MPLFLATPFPALALDAPDAPYDPTVGAEFFTSIAGVGYIGLVLFLLFRLLQRRAQRATSQARPVLSAQRRCIPPSCTPTATTKQQQQRWHRCTRVCTIV